MITVQIPAQMVAGIAAVQKKLQQEIAVREIAIERNPSSNVQINSFKMYGKHPDFVPALLIYRHTGIVGQLNF